MRSHVTVVTNALIINILWVSCFTEPFDCCSSSLPQTQSTVVLIKSCAALLTFSPMVILGYSHCEGCCKPPHEPAGSLISPYRAFIRSFHSISHICLNIGLELDREIFAPVADSDFSWDISGSESQAVHQILYDRNIV